MREGRAGVPFKVSGVRFGATGPFGSVAPRLPQSDLGGARTKTLLEKSCTWLRGYLFGPSHGAPMIQVHRCSLAYLLFPGLPVSQSSTSSFLTLLPMKGPGQVRLSQGSLGDPVLSPFLS